MAKNTKNNTGDVQLASPDKADFSRVYFDTCALDQGWPQISRDFADMLAVAKSVGIPCFIPKPVLVELEEHWMAKFSEKLRAFRSHVQGCSLICPFRGMMSHYLSIDFRFRN
jgi:hypothetical protein